MATHGPCQRVCRPGPGSLLARECVEAIRLGTPIIVPEHSGAAGRCTYERGGATFDDPDELLAAAEGNADSRPTGPAVSDAGRRYADNRYGDPVALVTQIRALLN